MVAVADRIRDLAAALPRRRALPLSDAGALRAAIRRTTVVRLSLAVFLLLLVALALWRATALAARPLPFLPAGTTTEVVLDQSKSIDPSAYRKVGRLLRALVAADSSVGLVAFSDIGYELMPPGSRGSELAPVLRYYTEGRGAGSNVDPSTLFPANPWEGVFSGGTAISTGLVVAERALHRDHVRNGTIVLASDLESDDADLGALARVLTAIANDRTVRLEILPLSPDAQSLAFFRGFVNSQQFIEPSQLQVHVAGSVHRRLIGLNPWALLVVGSVLLLALAVNELVGARVLVPRPQGAVQ